MNMCLPCHLGHRAQNNKDVCIFNTFSDSKKKTSDHLIDHLEEKIGNLQASSNFSFYF